MSIITAENLGVSFGAFDLFAGLSATIAGESKIGLIGPNGVGKTTLLLILAGMSQPTQGRVHLARGRRIGYLPQEAMDAFSGHTSLVYAEMLAVFSELQERQAELHHIEEQMAAGDHAGETLELYGRLQHAFEDAGGYEYEQRIQRTLRGLGLPEETWQLPVGHLSGGQKTRLLLARLLLEKPDLLMMDEPTNHLDIEAVEWLENTLRDWGGALLIVSHDRYFLDSTVNTIWEMSAGAIDVYKGGYSAYLMQRQERLEYQERVYEEEKARLLHEVDFIQRNWVRASTHARALGLLRKVSRELAIVENYGIMALRNGMKWSEAGLSSDRPLDVIEAIRKVNAIESPVSGRLIMRPRLASQKNSGNIVLRLEGAEIGYPTRRLFNTGSAELRRGECAVLIGPNGSGKTTFLKVLLGQLEPLSGEVRLGASLKIGYFAQAQEHLVGEHALMEELNRHKEMLPSEARSYLAQYLFRGEDVFKPLDALSGGERARLALAILALDGSNFLVLDEPTNHLDIPAQEALQAVLEDFNGTILLVSHDRFLIDRLASQIWEIRGEKLQIFPGGYRQYLLQGAQAAAGKPPTGSPKRKADKPAARPTPHLTRPLVRGANFQARKHIELLERLEERIRQQEFAVQRLNQQLQRSNGKGAYDSLNDLSWQLASAQAELERLMGEWERMAIQS